MNLDTRPKTKADNFTQNLMDFEANFPKPLNMVEINERLRSQMSSQIKDKKLKFQSPIIRNSKAYRLAPHFNKDQIANIF